MQVSLSAARALFRLAQVVSFMPLVEFLLSRTAWSAIPIALYYIYLIVFFRCANCGVNLVDKRVVSHIGNRLDFLERCPNCGKAMR